MVTTTSNVRLNGQDKIRHKPFQHDGMLAVGWVTVGYYDNESTPTIYGVFNDKKQAIEWLAKLQSGHVQVVYAPSYNRG